ncbi:MAG: DUF4846 domain-containing protein [Bacteroidetes bacterium]|nr:DUF4846 domain-containing protein [Bacteroidota bacterium]
MRTFIIGFAVTAIVLGCSNNSIAYYIPGSGNSKLVDKEGKCLKDRFLLPPGYTRTASNTFADYLRNVKLKQDGADVLHYDGSIKYKNVHAAVIDMEIGDKDLEQCADAVMRLRAEYLYTTKQYDKIHFNFTNGFRADYTKWMEGYRIRLDGNAVKWIKAAAPTNTHQSFRQYLDVVFNYAGTLSLSKELQPVSVTDVQPGDVFIRGGSPGHAVIVMDVAQNAKGEKIFMLAQSYMPAQEIEILINPDDKALSPWYKADTKDTDLNTPEYYFTTNDLKRFKNE